MEFLTQQNCRRKPASPLLVPGRAATRCVIPFVLALLLWAGGVRAQGQTVSREYPLKAVFLLNFAQFTDWPTNTLTATNAPFVIGVLGRDPFDGALDEAVRNENWNGHPMIIRRFAQLRDLADCQILFICDSESRLLPKILGDLRGRPVLTVSDTTSSSAGDVGILFVTRNNKIRFRVNTDSLKTAGLMVSSKLLRVAEVVPPPDK